MVATILSVGSLSVIILFAVALTQTSGRCSRAEEEAERRRWEEMQRRKEE